MGRWKRLLPPALLLLLPLLAQALVQEDARNAGCLTAKGAQSCAPCHPGDAAQRWEGRAHACTPYCLTCHTKDAMDKHHPVGGVLRRTPGAAYPLAQGARMACFTCHDLSRPRYDTVRWKASSLYDRLLRSEPRYPTYFLATRNDHGQLCLACH